MSVNGKHGSRRIRSDKINKHVSRLSSTFPNYGVKPNTILFPIGEKFIRRKKEEGNGKVFQINIIKRHQKTLNRTTSFESNEIKLELE